MCDLIWFNLFSMYIYILICILYWWLTLMAEFSVHVALFFLKIVYKNQLLKYDFLRSVAFMFGKKLKMTFNKHKQQQLRLVKQFLKFKNTIRDINLSIKFENQLIYEVILDF